MLDGQFEDILASDKFGCHGGQHLMLHLLKFNWQVVTSLNIVQHQETSLFARYVFYTVAHANHGVKGDDVGTLGTNFKLPEGLHDNRVDVKLFLSPLVVAGFGAHLTNKSHL